MFEYVAGKLSLSSDGTSGYLGTEENRNAFIIGENLTVTTLGYSSGCIYANLINNGAITTQAGTLTLNGSTVVNTGTMVTGGQYISLVGVGVSGNGADSETLRDAGVEKPLIDALRTRNGNLEITVSKQETTSTEL